jgi:hypothetical protein
MQIVGVVVLPTVITRPLSRVQELKVNVALGASALVFATILQESPLPMLPVLNPLVSAVPEEMDPPPIVQLVEPVNGCTVTPKVRGLTDPGQAADLIFRAPSVNVVWAVHPEV